MTGSSRAIRSLAKIGISVMTGMTVYEGLKQWLFPDIAIWTSHVTTILFSTLVGTTAGFFAFRAHRKYQGLAVQELAERQNAEEKLRRSEERFRSLVDNSEEVIGLFDKDGRWIYASSSVQRLWGYTVEEMLQPREFGELLHLDDLEEVRRRFRILAESSGVPMMFELRGRYKDGAIRAIQVSAVNRLDDPSIGAIVVNFRDVTEQKKAEAALRSSEERFRTLIERSPVAIGIARKGKTLYANEKYAEMFGFSSGEELRGLPITDQWAPQSRPEVEERVRRRDLALPVDDEFEGFAQRKDGSQFPVQAATSLVQLADGPANIAFLTDITARRRAEEALRASRLVIERSQEVAGVASWRWDMTRTPPRLEWSNHLYRLLGLQENPETATEELFFDLTHPDDRKVLTERRAALQAGAPRDETFRLRMKHADGNYRWFRSRGQPQFDGDGKMVEVIGAAQDITDQVEAQELSRKNETMLALGNLVAGVAHEVRNPLFAISGTLDAFEADFGDHPDFREYTAVLRREIGRLSALMHDLLEYGRPLSPKLSPGSVPVVARRAAATCVALAKERGVEIVTNVEEDLPEVELDSSRLTQVFQNLIQNAVEHSRPGSRVVVTIAGDRTQADSVISTVEDAGPGIRQEDLSRVFEPFFTRRTGGTGLGLSIVEKIVEEHAGRILAGNRTDGGAIMTVRLPAVK